MGDVLLSHWVNLLTAFWKGFFQFFGADFHRDGVVPATFIFAMLFMGLGALFLEKPSEEEVRRARQKSFWESILERERSVRYAEGLAIGFTIALAALYLINSILFDSQFKDDDLNFGWMKWVLILTTPFLYASIAFERSRTDFLHFLLLTISMMLLYTLMLVPVASEARSRGQQETWSVAFMIINLSVFLIPTKMMTLVTLAKPKFWNMRMLYVWLTIALIMALDWIARSAISMQPPNS